MEWVQVSLDTASFEVVRNCWQSLLSLLQEGLVDLLLCNEDEALAVAEASICLNLFTMHTWAAPKTTGTLAEFVNQGGIMLRVDCMHTPH